MSGIPTFVIGDLAIESDVPKSWSFSALNAFEECPKRWALSRTFTTSFDGPVPQKPNRSNVEGSLLHTLIERYDHHTRTSNSEVFRPRRTLLTLVTEWSKDNATNPRIDAKALIAQVRIEEILRAFGEARNHVANRPFRHSSRHNSKEDSTSTPAPNGTETSLRDPASKLYGRVDFISGGEILDFKTGQQDLHHREQLLFYGALYLAVVGKPPTLLRLIYTATGELQDIPLPLPAEIQSTLETMRIRAAAADSQVVAKQFPAKPEASKCMFCHVRGLCDEYWISNGVWEQRPLNDGSLIDYRPTKAAKYEPAAFGLYIRDHCFDTSVALYLTRLETHLTAEIIRILNVRPEVTDGEIKLVTTRHSEIYER